jgi:hypothetical protein
VPVIVGALGTIKKGLDQNLQLLPGHPSATELQKIALMSTAHILLSATNELQRYTIFFITVNALHVSGGFCAHHQELKTLHTA